MNYFWNVFIVDILNWVHLHISAIKMHIAMAFLLVRGFKEVNTIGSSMCRNNTASFLPFSSDVNPYDGIGP